METLAKIKVPTRNEVDERSQQAFDALEKKLGKVPNIYATIGYSGNVLTRFLEFSGGVGHGSFSGKEIEAIKLAVSEANNCEYCKSAHTVLGKMQGFSDEETRQLRSASHDDPRLRTLTTLARDVARHSGHVSSEIKEQFFALGYEPKDLIEFVAVVVSVTFTNYTHALTQVEIDFPKVA